MGDSKSRRTTAKKAKQPKEPRTLWLRVRLSTAEMRALQILGDRGDFATNVRQILLDRARGERTKVPNAIELRRLQLYLILDRQARLVRERYKVPAQDPLGGLLRAVEQLGKVKGEDHAGSSLD
jgi:hypothetical protein